MKWVEFTKPVFFEISKETGIAMGHDTHYDAQNFVFTKISGNKLHRLDFQPMENRSFVVTKYVDTFHFFPRLFRLLHNVVPMFPYLAKVEIESTGKISEAYENSALKKQLREHLANAL